MAILDQYGNSISTRTLAEPQTARLVHLQRWTVASHMSGLTPARIAQCLAAADQGNILGQHELFDDMFERDAHLRCEYEKRRGALLGLEWSVEPPSSPSAKEKKAAAAIEDILRNAVDDLEDLILAMMDGVGHGFAPIELEWQRIEGMWIPRFHPRPQGWFKMDMNRRELRLNDGSADGAVPLSMGWVMHQHVKAKTGYLGRIGLGRVLVWPFLYKMYSLGDMAEYLSTYGLPMIIGKYMPGAGEEEKASLMRAVTDLGRDARAIMPDGMSMEVMKVIASGDGTPHLSMMSWADGAQSKALLGQVLSAEAKATGMGSGVADLHQLVRRDILKADARQVAGTLTRDLVYPLAVLNGLPVQGMLRCPRFRFETGETADLKLLAEALPALAKGGAKIPLSWVHEKAGIPEADDGEDVFQVEAAPAPVPPVPPAPQPAAAASYRPLARAALAALSMPVRTAPADVVDHQLVALSAGAQPEVDAWLAAIEQMLADNPTATAVDVQERLLGMFGDLPIEQLAEVMAMGFAAAELAGMADVQDGR